MRWTSSRMMSCGCSWCSTASPTCPSPAQHGTFSSRSSGTTSRKRNGRCAANRPRPHGIARAKNRTGATAVSSVEALQPGNRSEEARGSLRWRHLRHQPRVTR
uniref:Putative secreted protein n=1 Tax=Anopheles triannulatus TaxID=58253 RepID=A0A2M4B3U7_9DIPT